MSYCTEHNKPICPECGVCGSEPHHWKCPRCAPKPRSSVRIREAELDRARVHYWRLGSDPVALAEHIALHYVRMAGVAQSIVFIAKHKNVELLGHAMKILEADYERTFGRELP